MEDAAFASNKTSDVLFYSCRAFEALPDLCHGFSTRLGAGCSQSDRSFNLGYTDWDCTKRTDENIHRFLSVLNLRDTTLATMRQIHSDRIHIIKEVPDKWNPPQGDALVTGVQGIALAVRTADCLPVLIADSKKPVIAAVHSGWRGTLQQIAFHTVREVQRTFSCNPADLRVAVGPGIRFCCFEVEQDVYNLFEKIYPGSPVFASSPVHPGKFHIDLPQIIHMQLCRAGLNPDYIYDLGLCTCCNTDIFFSHRAEGERSGRMMAVIGRA
jgi:YfiH family protein